MKFVNYAIVRFAVCLMAGILTAYFFPLSSSVFPILLGAIFLCILLWIRSHYKLFQDAFFSIAVYCSFFLIGYFNLQMRLPEFRKNHYSHYITEDRAVVAEVKIVESLKPDLYNDKFYASVVAIEGKAREGKILLNIKKDSSITLPAPDDILLLSASFKKPPKPLNPYQFNYASYLQNQQIYHQVNSSSDEIITSYRGRTSLFGIAQNLRASIIEKLRETAIGKEERGIIQALILGEKRDINKNLYSQYAAAGAVHILAVSGLHIGILFVFLTLLFKPLARNKKGRVLQFILILLILWGFAFLAGLSPSVIRAVTMFSFFAVALIFNRRTSGINTLFLSLLTLLLINPFWIFQVGFQLSYLAVFFILWFQPIFRRWIYSKNFILREAKSIIAVTLSAQIGVLPLTLYYFHQFPGLFILTNLVILPTLTVFMVLGIFIVVFAYFEILPTWLAAVYNYMVQFLNDFIGWVASQEQFLFQNIHFSTSKVIVSYLLIISLTLFRKEINRKTLLIAAASFLLLMGIFIQSERENATEELYVFHKSRETIIGHKHGKNLTLFTSHSESELKNNSIILAFVAAKNIKNVEISALPKALEYRNKIIFIVDETAVVPTAIPIDILVLTQNSKINLSKILENLQPQQLIADGSNYPTQCERWKETSIKKKLPFHNTAKMGAIKIE